MSVTSIYSNIKPFNRYEFNSYYLKDIEEGMSQNNNAYHKFIFEAMEGTFELLRFVTIKDGQPVYAEDFLNNLGGAFQKDEEDLGQTLERVKGNKNFICYIACFEEHQFNAEANKIYKNARLGEIKDKMPSTDACAKIYERLLETSRKSEDKAYKEMGGSGGGNEYQKAYDKSKSEGGEDDDDLPF